jgi:5-methylcytosine-specific restriction endonuclease McrA
MAFGEGLKLRIRRKAHSTCSLCKSLGVEVHHIIPQEEGGSNSEDNATPIINEGNM